MTATPARAGLDELDALLAAATPGPWQREPNMRLADGCRCLSCWEPTEPGSWDISPVDGPDCSEHGCWHNIRIGTADAALIVALRNAAPAMVAAIRAAYALAEELDRVAAVGDPARGSYDDGIRVSSHFAATSLRAALDEALGVAK